MIMFTTSPESTAEQLINSFLLLISRSLVVDARHLLLARARLCHRCLEQLLFGNLICAESIIVSASQCLNPKSVLAVRELRLVDVSPSQYTMLPLNQLTCLFMCSFISFRSLTL